MPAGFKRRRVAPEESAGESGGKMKVKWRAFLVSRKFADDLYADAEGVRPEMNRESGVGSWVLCSLRY